MVEDRFARSFREVEQRFNLEKKLRAKTFLGLLNEEQRITGMYTAYLYTKDLLLRILRSDLSEDQKQRFMQMVKLSHQKVFQAYSSTKNSDLKESKTG